MIILYFETCYAASMVSPGGVVVITPDWRPGDVASSPSQGIQPIFSEEYIEKKKDAHIHMLLCEKYPILVSQCNCTCYVPSQLAIICTLLIQFDNKIAYFYLYS